jgi:hypothetical protein
VTGARKSKVGAWLKLVRAGTLFSPAADVVAGACLAGAPWNQDVLRAAMASVLVYAAGMVLNDHADRREDAVHRPERPIPRGEISAGIALTAGLVAMAVGIALSPAPVYWAGIATLVLVYDYIAKRWLPIAALTMGSLRGLNLCAGTVAATGHVGLDAPVVGPALAYATYILAVTLLGALEDEPRVRPRAVLGVQSVAPLVALAGLLATPNPTLPSWLGLGLAAVFFARQRRIGLSWDQRAIRGSMLWLLLGTMAYTGLLCLGSGQPWAAVGIFVAARVARAVARRIALT